MFQFLNAAGTGDINLILRDSELTDDLIDRHFLHHVEFKGAVGNRLHFLSEKFHGVMQDQRAPFVQ